MLTNNVVSAGTLHGISRIRRRIRSKWNVSLAMRRPVPVKPSAATAEHRCAAPPASKTQIHFLQSTWIFLARQQWCVRAKLVASAVDKSCQLAARSASTAACSFPMRPMGFATRSRSRRAHAPVAALRCGHRKPCTANDAKMCCCPDARNRSH